MSDVRLPDGRIVRNVPEGITKQELMRRIEAMDAQQKRADFNVDFEDPGALRNVMIQAGARTVDLGRGARQFFNEITGDTAEAASIGRKRQAADELMSRLRDQRPYTSIAGDIIPSLAVPGGKLAQIGAGAAEGFIEEEGLGRIAGAAKGAAFGFLGQKVGDEIGKRFQSIAQRVIGNPNAAARKALIDAGIPLTLSQRTDGAVSKPLSRFFERARFVFTGSQPLAAKQQKAMTRLVTDALGVKGDKLTRQALGNAVENNRAVFRTAAQRAGRITPDDELIRAASRAEQEFARVGSDSRQIERVFDNFLDSVSAGKPIDPDVFLKIRSNLSEMTTKSDAETTALVKAIDALDSQLSRLNPDLAADLLTARDRFRLLLAIRRGAAISPQGDINLNSFTRNLERVFSDFDANVPLPRGLERMGEAVASANQIFDPFRSSQTAENLLSAGLPAGLANASPGAAIRAAAGLVAPFAGGGTGGLLGGGLVRGTLLPDEREPSVFTQ